MLPLRNAEPVLTGLSPSVSTRNGTVPGDAVDEVEATSDLSGNALSLPPFPPPDLLTGSTPIAAVAGEVGCFAPAPTEKLLYRGTATCSRSLERWSTGGVTASLHRGMALPDVQEGPQDKGHALHR
ncbi:hypothetical protein MRX96_012943 [Rhipicephalus microplus]